MFRILTQQTCGEGIITFREPKDHEGYTFSNVVEAAHALVENYGQGIVATLTGEEVLRV